MWRTDDASRRAMAIPIVLGCGAAVGACAAARPSSKDWRMWRGMCPTMGRRPVGASAGGFGGSIRHPPSRGCAPEASPGAVAGPSWGSADRAAIVRPLIRSSAISHRARVVRAVVWARLAAAAVFASTTPAEVRESAGAPDAGVGPWRRIEGARFEERRYADGDSFVLTHDGTSVVYRLYFVDAPEMDAEFPDRVREQAKRFGVGVREIPGLGRRAADFAAQWLREGAVTVWTRDEPAGGREESGRRFALVGRGRRWLHEELVAAGWARVYGHAVDLPDGTTAARHRHRLDELEAEARREGRGVWARSALRKRQMRSADRASPR